MIMLFSLGSFMFIYIDSIRFYNIKKTLLSFKKRVELIG
jgi:hypothetical protein